MSDAPEFDEALIRRLAALLEETGLDEIEIGEGERHVRVARRKAPAVSAPAPALAVAAAPAAAAVDAVAAAPAAAAVDAGAAVAAGAVDADHPGAVSSPMVGTLYVASGPGEAPFVVEGGMIAEGEIMFIIEAMKTMNPVRAPRGGTVARILVGNASPVEYGEVLALIE